MILKSEASEPVARRADLQTDSRRTARTSPPPVTAADIIAPVTKPLVNTVQETAPVEPVKSNDMAWKPKTIAGKILKGAVIGGGTVLGIASGVGAIAGIAGGAGALAGAVGGISTVTKAAASLATGVGRVVGKSVSGVANAAVNLVTGTTSEQRAQVREVKAATKASENQLEQVQRLIRAGASEEQALSMTGLSKQLLPELNGVKLSNNKSLFDLSALKGKTADAAKVINGQPLSQSNNTPLYIGAAALAFLLLPKILKR